MRSSPRRVVSTAAIALTIALIATGCASNSSSSPTTSGGLSGPINVGMVDSETGGVAGSGIANICGSQVEVAAINASGGVDGSKINLTVADDQSTPSVAAQQAQKLVSQGIRLFVGGSTSETVSAELPYLKKSNSLFMGGTTQSAAVLDYYPMLRVNNSSDQAMKWFAGYLAKHAKPGPLALVGLEGAFTTEEFTDLNKYIDKSKFPTVKTLIAPATTTDWSSYVSQIQSLHATAIINAIYGRQQPVSWYTDVYNAGVNVQQYAAPGILSTVVISELPKNITQGLVGSANWVPTIKSAAQSKMLSDFKKYSPSLSACKGLTFDVAGGQMQSSYDQILVLAGGIKKADSTDPSKVRPAVIKGTWDLPQGSKTTFDSQGQASQTFYVYTVKDGVLTPTAD